MYSLCRLCATCTEPTELITEIVELESKLSLCCGWQPAQNENQMPKKACNSCVRELQRSWNLVEQIRLAETQLNKLLVEQIQFSSNPNLDQLNIEIKAEHDAEQAVNYLMDTKFDADQDYFNEDGGGQCDSNSELGDNSGDVFGESIDFFNDDDSKSDKIKKPPELTKKTHKKSNPKSFKSASFFATLEPDDYLENGQITTNAITKLAKLYPDMNQISWNEIQYNCVNCHQIVKGANTLYAHMRSMHCDDPKMSIKISCFYCDFKHRRERTLNQHIYTEHYEHLKYR